MAARADTSTNHVTVNNLVTLSQSETKRGSSTNPSGDHGGAGMNMRQQQKQMPISALGNGKRSAARRAVVPLKHTLRSQEEVRQESSQPIQATCRAKRQPINEHHFPQDTATICNVQHLRCRVCWLSLSSQRAVRTRGLSTPGKESLLTGERETVTPIADKKS